MPSNGFLKKKVVGNITVQFICDLYDAFIRNPGISDAARTLEVPPGILQQKFSRRPELHAVKDLAISRAGNENRLANYVFERMSPAAKEIWETIQFWKDSDREHEVAERYLKQRPRHLRQEVFFHALMHTHYNITEACRMVGLSKTTIGAWQNEDPNFVKLLEEVHWHKKNFFENALLDLVQDKNPHAVMFVNRTINADRGYNEKLHIEHSGQVNSGFGLEDLDLDIETRRKVLEAIRRKELTKSAKATHSAIEVGTETKQLQEKT